jgi:hypothetical protein
VYEHGARFLWVWGGVRGREKKKKTRTFSERQGNGDKPTETNQRGQTNGAFHRVGWSVEGVSMPCAPMIRNPPAHIQGRKRRDVDCLISLTSVSLSFGKKVE